MRRCTGRDRRSINQTFYRLRLIVLIALTTGMRIAEIFALKWSDLLYGEELDRSSGQAEGRQDSVRADAAGAGSELQQVSGGHRGGAYLSSEAGSERGAAESGEEFRDHPGAWPESRISVSTICGTRSRPGT